MHALFGTDGVRGVANDFLTVERALAIGRAVGSVLMPGRRYRPLVLIGEDTRLSSTMLADAVSAGLCSVGADVLRLSVVPTPAVAYLVMKYKARAGIMISASHNSYEYNGIKIFDEDGFKLPDALEEQIEGIVMGSEPPPPLATLAEIGTVSYATNAREDYITHVRSTVPFSLDGISVAIDCACGSAALTAQRLFTSLGASCVMLADKPDGVNINEGCGSTHIDRLSEFVKQNHLDCGIAFDGDADRCLAVDEHGRVIDGDMVMAIISLDMKARGKLEKNALVGTVMSNLGLLRFCETNGIDFHAAKVGDRYVLERMREGGFCFGGEQSGHIIFRDFATTGDGQMTAAQLLSLMRRTGKKMSELSSVMKKYPQYTVNLTVSPEAKVAFFADRDVKKALLEWQTRLGDTGRIVVRPSGTEPLLRVMIEGETEEQTKQMTEEAASEFAAILEKY